MRGIIPFFKPENLTSHDFINRLRKITNERKIGHAGTLDPLARGVLVIAIGSEFTRLIKDYVSKEKEYQAVIRLGWQSSTDDREGIKKRISEKVPLIKEVKEVVMSFQGTLMQKPPLYSAIKVSGERAYNLARKNIEFDLKSRKVDLKKIKLIRYKYPFLEIKIETGPGFYVRSLARDIGLKLKTGAYLEDLERTRVGEFKLKDSLKI